MVQGDIRSGTFSKRAGKLLNHLQTDPQAATVYKNQLTQGLEVAFVIHKTPEFQK